MDLFDILTWAKILVKTTFLGTPTLTVLWKKLQRVAMSKAPTLKLSRHCVRKHQQGRSAQKSQLVAEQGKQHKPKLAVLNSYLVCSISKSVVQTRCNFPLVLNLRSSNANIYRLLRTKEALENPEQGA
jgi:hypothetical protein